MISSAVSASIDLVLGNHHAHFHELFDNIGHALCHTVGEFRDNVMVSGS